MEITEELLDAGRSERGGLSRQQIQLLGSEWPLRQGWKRSLIGKAISDKVAEEFLRLAGKHLANKGEKRIDPVNWFGGSTPVDIHLYVLELADGCYYVGLTADIESRVKQHVEGTGAVWTKLHRPLRVLHTVCTGTRDAREAEQMENEVTITLMMRYGVEKVRGGHYCTIELEPVEALLRTRGVWNRMKQAALDRQVFHKDASWSEALDSFAERAMAYYEAGAPADQHDDVFAACYKLTRYRHWHEDFAPGLSWHFWNRKGILPVILSFKHGRPVGSRVSSPYEVLANALMRGTGGKHPLRRLFLLAWRTYLPPATNCQLAAVDRHMSHLADVASADRQYDAFVSVLFPEMRYCLRE